MDVPSTISEIPRTARAGCLAPQRSWARFQLSPHLLPFIKMASAWFLRHMLFSWCPPKYSMPRMTCVILSRTLLGMKGGASYTYIRIADMTWCQRPVWETQAGWGVEVATKYRVCWTRMASAHCALHRRLDLSSGSDSPIPFLGSELGRVPRLAPISL